MKQCSDCDVFNGRSLNYECKYTISNAYIVILESHNRVVWIVIEFFLYCFDISDCSTLYICTAVFVRVSEGYSNIIPLFLEYV